MEKVEPYKDVGEHMYSEPSLIQHSMGLKKTVGLQNCRIIGGCQITE